MMDARPEGARPRAGSGRGPKVFCKLSNEEETTMGGILEAVEMLKSPVGIIVALLAIGAIVLFVRWIKQD
jgi:hypothetical protein